MPHDHTGDTGTQDSLDARRCPAEMVAGLERNIQCGPPGRPSGSVQGHYLGVGTARPRMPAFAQYVAVARDNGPHEGIRRDGVAPALGEAAGKIHHRILQHFFLSPIRTLTVGAGLRFVEKANLHRLNLHRRLAGSPCRSDSRTALTQAHRRCGNFTRPRKLRSKLYHTSNTATRKRFAFPHAPAYGFRLSAGQLARALADLLTSEGASPSVLTSKAPRAERAEMLSRALASLEDPAHLGGG